MTVNTPRRRAAQAVVDYLKCPGGGNMRQYVGAGAALGLLAAVVLSNWLTSTFGMVPVGLGLVSTAGTFSFGLALALRDATQDSWGFRAMLAVVGIGAVVSYLVADPMVAVASAAAFALAELLNATVYTPIRTGSTLGGVRWATAVVVAGLLGAVLDSIVFLWVAFGWETVTTSGVIGQMVGKGYALVAYLIVGWVVSRAIRRERVPA